MLPRDAALRIVSREGYEAGLHAPASEVSMPSTRARDRTSVQFNRMLVTDARDFMHPYAAMQLTGKNFTTRVSLLIETETRAQSGLSEKHRDRYWHQKTELRLGN